MGVYKIIVTWFHSREDKTIPVTRRLNNVQIAFGWNIRDIFHENNTISFLIPVKVVDMKKLATVFVVVVYPLPWPLFVGGGGSPIIPLLVHQPGYSSIWPAAPYLQRGSVHKSTGDNVVRTWVKLKRWCVSCVWILQKGHIGDRRVLSSTLCKYDLRKGYLLVLSWAKVRRVRWGSMSSELLMCGGGERSILLLSLVARCLETIYVCIWRMFVFKSVEETVWGYVGRFVV